MPRRTISDTKSQIERKNAISKHVLIEETPFPVSNSLEYSEQLCLQYDDKNNIISDINDGYFYKRPNFIVVSSEEDDDYSDIIRKLSNKAYTLFRYIRKHILYNCNYIVLSNEQIKDIIKVKHDSNVSTIIHELIKYKLIARNRKATDRNTLIINHNIFFKGSYNKFTYKYNKVYKPDKQIIINDESDY